MRKIYIEENQVFLNNKPLLLLRSTLLRIISLFFKFRVSFSAIDYVILNVISLFEAISKKKLLKIWRDLSSLKKEILINF